MAGKLTSITMGPLACRPQNHRGIRDDGRAYWRIARRGKGGKTLTSGWMTAEEAQTEAARLIAAGLPEEVKVKAVPETMGDLLKAYASTYAGSTRHRPGTLANVKRTIKHLRRHLDDVPLDRVNAQTVAMYVSARDREKASTGTIVKEHVLWASAWNYGVGCGWVAGALPEHGVTVRSTYNTRTPTAEEVEKVITWLDTVDGFRKDGQPRKGRAEWPALAVLVAFTTGMRVGEIEAMRWRDVDLDASKLTLRRHEDDDLVKTPRTIPIPRRLRTALRAWFIRQGSPDRDDHVLGVRPGILRSKGRDKIANACEKLEIDTFTWHGIRRRVVRRYRKALVPVKEAAALLGHSPVVMLRLYDEVEPGDLESTVARLDDLAEG